MNLSRRARVGLAVGAVAAVAAPALAVAHGMGVIDWGLWHQDRTEAAANRLYGGIGTPLDRPATPAPEWGADSVELASGLRARVVPTGDRANADPADHLYQNADMIAFYPRDTNPEWAIVCIENNAKVPGLQRVKLTGADRGTVQTIFTGTESCDGVRTTPWGTILATEERGDGNAIEVYDPIHTTGVQYDRKTGVATGADGANVVTRPALGRFAWEGLEVFPDGSVIAGDELGPKKRVIGGGVYKFVSDQPPAQGVDLSKAASAAQSPLAKGSLYVLEVGAPTDNRGQGTQTGRGRWIGPIDPAKAREESAAKGTGFYRPEDLHADPMATARGERRVCWTNTGNAEIGNYGEVLCLDDRADDTAPTGATPDVQPFVLGNPEMNQPDNLAFQPGTGIAYVIEDTPFIDHDGDGTPESHPGEVWACLPDGQDRDLQSDGCVRVLSLRTATDKGMAEPTGFTFDGTGRTAYVNIQHSPDDPDTAEDETTTDDMLQIMGFRPRPVRTPAYGR